MSDRFERVPTDTIAQAVEREIEWLKKTDPGADNPETRLRIQREIEEGRIQARGVKPRV
jgi:hypothetical protein